MTSSHPTIGFIGQGWIGKNYADDFEARGLNPVRYSLDAPYIVNKDKIPQCDIVFIAVPTPTRPGIGFDDSIVQNALSLVGEGKTAVIKSTVLPDTVEKMQEKFPHIFVLSSPEFLVEKTAAHDAAHPQRNIIGIPRDTPEYRRRAEEVLAVLPPAPYSAIMSSKAASFVKYAGNVFLFSKVMFVNVLYDMVKAQGLSWDEVREAFAADPRIGESHTTPVYDNGRGAGGDCFIKDFEAFVQMYKMTVGELDALVALESLRDFNVRLLTESGKDLELLRGVYGEQIKQAV